MDISWSELAGVTMSWTTPQGLRVGEVSVRIAIDGQIAYRVWSGHEAGLLNGVSGRRGEEPPYWAEEGLQPEFFGPDRRPRISQIAGDGQRGYRIESEDDRGAVVLEVVEDDRGLSFALSVGCSSRQWRLPLPACAVALSLANLDLGPDAAYTGAMTSPADFLPSGRVSDLSECGVTFHPFGVCAMCLPVVCQHDRADWLGLRWVVMCGDRPHLRILPGQNGRARVDVAWPLSRQIQPGQWHRFAGPIRVEGFGRGAVQAIRDWRDDAAERYAIAPPPTADWIRRSLMAEVNLNPEVGGHDFRRLDDPRARELLERLVDMGYTVLWLVGQFNIGTGWLSPLDYRTREDLGGEAAERQFLTWPGSLGCGR
jgi:hypothetical protein